MSRYPDITSREVNFYGLRTWVEYGLKQSKNELGWADYRLTHYPGRTHLNCPPRLKQDEEIIHDS